jgi:hypothetical protein
VGEPNLSQAEQVSQEGEPTVDRGDPFRLLGYDCRWLKLDWKESGRGSLGPILDPCSQRAALNGLPNFAKFNFNVCKHIPIC